PSDAATAITRATRQGASSPFVSTGLTRAYGLAFDAQGNLDVANNGNGTVSKYSPTGALLSATFVTGVFGAQGLAFDPQGNLYVSTGFSSIGKFAPDGTAINRNFVFTFFSTTGLAVDAQGNLYVAGNNQVSKYSPQ